MAADECCTVRQGDRVAQLILERIVTPEVLEVDELDATQRGSGGYGSTGVAS
jgi:dUTP pyrophosphatase